MKHKKPETHNLTNFLWLLLCRNFLWEEKLSFCSFLCINERIFNPLKRKIHWRNFSVLNFSLNYRVTAVNSLSLPVGRGMLHLIGETGNWGEFDIHRALVVRGCGYTAIQGLGYDSLTTLDLQAFQSHAAAAALPFST